ncbi:hypothetical protein ACP6PL_15635 [Dapis sp. BLCC M126]|uniref:hypothetical protein n=1 Tax=Dapis sp. BLCC M126 TaxID=3400189 RepID=UPI003CF631A8
MFTLSELKKTKVYQEAFAEGKDESKAEAEVEVNIEYVSNMIRLGLAFGNYC